MLRILVIDDEQDFHRILSMVLTKLGYDVVVAEDGEKGMELFNEVPHFDLVITNIRMPGMNGNEVARQIKNSNKSDTPLVAITGFADEIQNNMFDSLLLRPFQLEDFKKVARSFD